MFKKIMYFIFIVCLLISNLYVPKVYGKTLGDLKEELEQYKSDYEQNKLEKELSEQEIKQIESNINSISNEIYESGEEIKRLNDEIITLNEEIKKDEEEIKDILQFTQIQNGESAYLEYAFGAKTFTDFIYRLAISEQLTTYNEQLIEKNKQNIEDNKTKTKELEDKKIELAKQQDDLKVELDKLQDDIQAIDEEALSIEDLIKVQEAQIKLYEDLGCSDNEDIDVCGRDVLPPDTSFWRPITKGMISGTLGLYGPRTPCGGEISCFHNGMDFTVSGANNGTTPVYSAASGIVISVIYGSSCGGNKIFIQHNVNGELYITGYLHMHEVFVKSGDWVSKDTEIGIMGGFESYDTCSNGGHLHFEISTGSFDSGTYYSKRFNPDTILNLPSQVNTYWYDRTTRY